ncbi:MAG: hypothetical protein ABFD92_14190 [Planctomycetaceae bacterium]|nr:hypothetical protein [Planctomycetaceae bacterium]
MRHLARIMGLGLLLAAGAAAGGCTREITVTQYPSFYSPDLRTIAVMPFGSLTPDPPAGVFFTDRMIDALVANGSYRVVSGPTLLGELRQAGAALPSAPATRPGPSGQPAAEYYQVVPPPAAGPPPEQLLAALRRRGGVDLLLLGRVTALHAQPVLVRDTYPYGPYDPYPYPLEGPYGRGYYVSYTYQTQATAAAAIELYRVSDGRRLASTQDTATVVSVGPGQLTMEESLGRASQEVARQLVRAIAPAPATIKVRKDRALETSRRTAGGGLKETSTFARGDGAVMVTVRLPPEADRNPFTLTVTPEGASNTVLFDREFTWSRSQTSQTIEVPIAALSGQGNYRVHLRQGGLTVLSRKVSVKD